MYALVYAHVGFCIGIRIKYELKDPGPSCPHGIRDPGPSCPHGIRDPGPSCPHGISVITVTVTWYLL